MTVGYSACEDCMALKEAVLVLYDNTDCKVTFLEYIIKTFHFCGYIDILNTK